MQISERSAIGWFCKLSHYLYWGIWNVWCERQEPAYWPNLVGSEIVCNVGWCAVGFIRTVNLRLYLTLTIRIQVVGEVKKIADQWLLEISPGILYSDFFTASIGVVNETPCWIFFPHICYTIDVKVKSTNTRHEEEKKRPMNQQAPYRLQMR